MSKKLNNRNIILLLHQFNKPKKKNILMICDDLKMSKRRMKMVKIAEHCKKNGNE